MRAPLIPTSWCVWSPGTMPSSQRRRKRSSPKARGSRIWSWSRRVGPDSVYDRSPAQIAVAIAMLFDHREACCRIRTWWRPRSGATGSGRSSASPRLHDARGRTEGGPHAPGKVRSPARQAGRRPGAVIPMASCRPPAARATRSLHPRVAWCRGLQHPQPCAASRGGRTIQNHRTSSRPSRAGLDPAARRRIGAAPLPHRVLGRGLLQPDRRPDRQRRGGADLLRQNAREERGHAERVRKVIARKLGQENSSRPRRTPRSTRSRCPTRFPRSCSR